MLKKAIWMIAVASLAMPIALQAQTTAPKAEEDKVSEPAKTSSKKDKAAKPAKMTPEQEKKVQMTGSEDRKLAPPKKMTKEEKQADIKAKRTGVTPKEEAEQAKKLPGG
jgi:hypothetical protein